MVFTTRRGMAIWGELSLGMFRYARNPAMETMTKSMTTLVRWATAKEVSPNSLNRARKDGSSSGISLRPSSRTGTEGR
jgi:hypothetical protein